MIQKKKESPINGIYLDIARSQDRSITDTEGIIVVLIASESGTNCATWIRKYDVAEGGIRGFFRHRELAYSVNLEIEQSLMRSAIYAQACALLL